MDGQVRLSCSRRIKTGYNETVSLFSFRRLNTLTLERVDSLVHGGSGLGPNIDDEQERMIILSCDESKFSCKR